MSLSPFVEELIVRWIHLIPIKVPHSVVTCEAMWLQFIHRSWPGCPSDGVNSASEAFPTSVLGIGIKMQPCFFSVVVSSEQTEIYRIHRRYLQRRSCRKVKRKTILTFVVIYVSLWLFCISLMSMLNNCFCNNFVSLCSCLCPFIDIWCLFVVIFCVSVQPCRVSLWSFHVPCGCFVSLCGCVFQ